MPAKQIKEDNGGSGKSYSFYWSKRKSKEAITTSMMPQLVRESKKPVKNSAFFESSTRISLAEAVDSEGATKGTKYRVTLIEEGLGNTGTGYYYPKESLMSAAKVFEGKKIYADHPDAMEEQTRPERSVRDIIGHFENVTYEETKGAGSLTGDLVLMKADSYEWARALIEHAIEYARKYANQDFIGLSINASGEADPIEAQEFLEKYPIAAPAKKKVEDAIESGLNEIKVVKNINDATSCDLVTEAGAGGKILELLEAKEIGMSKKKLKEDDAPMAMGADGKPAAPAPAADAAADAELIKQELKKHGLLKDGDDETATQEAMNMAGKYKKAYEAAGHKDGEAISRACEAMKAASHVHEAMNPVDEPAKPKEGEEQSPADLHNAKESEKKVMELTGELAGLKERLSKIDVRDHIEEKMKQSGLPMSVTKKFKEAVASAKSTKEVDEKFNLFMEGLKAVSGEDVSNFVINQEKLVRESGKSVTSLDDCVEE